MTYVRYRIVLISILTAFILYLDRICMAEITKSASFQEDFGLSSDERSRVLGAFFLSYALFQIPAGWLSDRFGARRMLSGYILGWSLFTGLSAFMTTASGLIWMRMGVGFTQAGAYPTISATIRRWIRIARRGQASSFVSFGGRLGGTLAPFITVLLLGWLGNWRQTLFLYSGIGVIIAIAYWIVVRDRPAEHPHCSQEEQEHIGQPITPERRPEVRDILRMLLACCSSIGLWLNSLAQFSINLGWAFLILGLTDYLKAAHEVPDQQAAFLVMCVLAMGMVGQPIGGWATDWSVRHFGLRRGRVLPLVLACAIAGCAYFGCAFINAAWFPPGYHLWFVVACCGIVSLMTDIGNPSNWAFMQDIGGKNTGVAFGWGNMWGNFGAALNASLIPVLYLWGVGMNWDYGLVFLVCGSAFFVASLSALGMDATRPLQPAADSFPGSIE